MALCADIRSSSVISPSSSTSSNVAMMPASFAFLNHSQQTIPQRLPPSVDNKPLARQKRRRTSPEDAAILEAEFQRDSKPDKSERGRIAHRVALGEKEIQIWFQNRRSTTRRRARPLTPPTNQEDNQGDIGTSSTYSAQSRDQTYNAHSPQSSTRVPTPCNTIDIEYSEVFTSEVRDEPAGSPSRSLEDENVDKAFGATRKTSEMETEVISDPLNSYTMDEPPGQQTEGRAHSRELVSQPKATHQRTQSGVRLSMTSEGLATILGECEASPSPPKMRAGLEDLASTPRGLRRSFSAAGLGDPLPSARVARAESGIRRVLRGRSRDSRAWEFWCDNDLRNDLAKKAEQETTGSAADAISLMRSTSRSVLIPIQDRRHIQDPRASSLKRSKSATSSKSRPSLTRSSSSIAQLQSGSHGIASSTGNSVTQKSTKPIPSVFEFGSGDSDKENRAPFASEDPTVHPDVSAKQPKKKQRPILGQSRTAPSQTRRVDTSRRRNQAPKLSRHFHSNEGKDNVHIDDEVARFMGGQGDSRQSDDLVVQGLLSLSQGAWR